MSARKWKQRIIDEYLNDTGVNLFVPRDFLAWLKGKPNHQCYRVFYGQTENEAAQAWREQLVRQWVSGLRIVVSEQEVPHSPTIIRIVQSEYSMPAVHSPAAHRRTGGGYYATDPTDARHVSELAAQGASSLRSWLDRFAGAASLIGVDPEPVREFAAALDAAARRKDQRPVKTKDAVNA